ncbi:MFS general substrate transporter [Saccharata proteae CBS 121410]|uniref:MFS general substrate transporter n=1 Tax=Saccharata proteae CBS 121410 TaxID=1314787 RepID=A0A9P4HV12_9PEZI|nr:MFS general substrate transporter [Saccharata proteae CBS 121410]
MTDETHLEEGRTEKISHVAPASELDDVFKLSDTVAPDTQYGVQRIEAVSTAWTKWSLIAAYIGLYLMAYTTSLEQQTTNLLTMFATSSFSAHSLISTVTVVQSVVNAVIKPPMGKLADVFGRFETFCLAVFLYTIGYIQQAGSNNVKTYASAQIFYSAGSQGLQVLQQIFVADTTDLLNRALFATIPDIPFLINVWVGPEVAQSILKTSTWRWGYGLWAIVLPIAFSPLAITLFLNGRKAKKMDILPPSPFKGQSVWYVLKCLWFELDFFGLLLLSAAVALILLPLTLASRQSGGWQNESIVAMLVIGGVCIVAFPFWERSKTLAPRAFFPRDLIKKRTVAVGVTMAFFYFMAYYLSVYPYFNSYLLVVQGKSVVAAGHITQTFTFSSTVSAVVVSLFIKKTGHYKYFVTLGACIYLMGLGLMFHYRAEGVSTGALVGAQIATGIGGGALNIPLQLGVQASASHQEVAAATAVFLTVLEIGGAVGSAISGAIWSNSIPTKLERYLPPETKGQAQAIYGNVNLASAGWPMGSPERIAINRAYQETMHTLLTVAVCVAAPLIPLSFFLKNYDLKKMDQKVKGRVIGGSMAGGHGENEECQTSSESPSEAVAARDEPTLTVRRSWISRFLRR